MTTSSLVQAALWPAISRLLSVVGVAGRGQGKTVGWVLPLLNQLTDKESYRSLPRGGGPVAVVLAAGWQTVRQVSDLLAEVSAKAGMRVEVVGVHAAREEEMKIKTTLINGVDVLVATPSSLLRLLKTKLTNMNRCCHLIIEVRNWHNFCCKLLQYFRYPGGRQGVALVPPTG